MLPQGYKNSLWYSNVLCGLIIGSLEMVNIRVSATFAKDVLRGDESTEIKVCLIEIMKDTYVNDDDWSFLTLYLNLIKSSKHDLILF